MMNADVVSSDDADIIRKIVGSVAKRDQGRLARLVDNEIRKPELLWKYVERFNERFVEPPIEFIAYSDITIFPDQSGYGIDVPLWLEGADKPSHIVVRLDVLTTSDPHRFIFRTLLAP